MLTTEHNAIGPRSRTRGGRRWEAVADLMLPERAAPPTVRRLRFEWPTDLDPDWTPGQPELACVANAVSLLMPHVEPYLVRAVRAVEPDLSEPLASEARAWIAQETAHHGAHARFNRLLVARRPGLARVDRWTARLFTWLDRRSQRFRLAYASGAETVAFLVARWVDRRASDLFRGADPEATTLFLWHLAEEVEHKSVAHDVHRASGGGRVGDAVGLVAALAVLAVATLAGTLVGLAGARRLHHPSTHWRMLVWTFSFAFEALPILAATLVGTHHPADLADPTWLTTWLRSYDPDTRTMPVWSLDVVR